MNKILKYFVIGLAIYALLSTIIALRSCNVSNKYSELEGRFQAYKEETTEEKKALLEEKKKHEERIIEKDNEILSLKETITKSNLKRIGYEKAERGNVQEIRKLKEDLVSLTDKNDIIFNLTNQVRVLEDSNRNKDKMLFEADKQIKNLSSLYLTEQKYLDERKLRISVEEQLAREERNNEIEQKMIDQLNKEMRGLKLKITVGNVALTGLAFLGGYFLGGR